MCSSSPPPAPDYESAARETARGNLEATRAAIRANRINQYTPYGRLTYKQTPVGKINYEAYNRALENYKNPLQTRQETYQKLRDGENLSYGGDSPGSEAIPGWATIQPVRPDGGQGNAPKPEDFMEYDPDTGWEQTMELTPEAQAALDQQLALNRKYGEVANLGFDRVRSIFENPELDVGALPRRAIDVGQTAQEALLARLNPQLQSQEEATRQRLANTGIGLGSDAFSREMAIQGQQANDLRLQAALQGINLDQANRAAALQEQAYLQDRPLNLINALRAGNQVQAPQFQQFAQQATTQGPDLLSATNAQYKAQMDAYNADQAAGSGMMSGLFGLGLGLAGLPVAGVAPGIAGGSLGGNALKGLFSDERLKKNIKPVGKMGNGLTIYSYEYIWGSPTQFGVMAQEVEKVIPEAVSHVNGYKMVDYARL